MPLLSTESEGRLSCIWGTACHFLIELCSAMPESAITPQQRKGDRARAAATCSRWMVWPVSLFIGDSTRVTTQPGTGGELGRCSATILI